jgi:hypothetical protein
MNSRTRSLEIIVKIKKLEKYLVNTKDKLVIISGEARKEHSYLIPKTKIHHYGDRRVYLNLSESSLKEFEFY